MSGKYAFVSFKLWTKTVKWKYLTWKLGTLFYCIFSLVPGLFPEWIFDRKRNIAGLFP